MTKPPEILPPDHTVYTEVIEAMRQYREAQDAGASAIEVERLRLIAEYIFQAVVDYQMRTFECLGRTPHLSATARE